MTKIKVWLTRAGVSLGAAAIGLIVAALLLPDAHLTWEGFLVTVIVFAIAQAFLAPLILKLVTRNAPAFLGGIGIVSTLVSLIIATLIANGLRISGILTWILATLIVWLITAIASFVLARFFLPAVNRPKRRKAI